MFSERMKSKSQYLAIPKNLLSFIEQGEGTAVEFKKSTKEITKDVYHTVCSFSNRNGGHIFLGIEDNGKISGVHPERVEAIKKDFITSVNNENIFYPPLYLTPAVYEYDGKIIFYIHVPMAPNVCRCTGRIFDRNNDSDIDITRNEGLVYQLYARKQDTYYVNKVFPVFREIGLADELGYGMRNTYKYTKLYSGAEPQFVEGDVFRTIIPLTEAATVTVGPTTIIQDAPQDISQSRMERLVKLMNFSLSPEAKKR